MHWETAATKDELMRRSDRRWERPIIDHTLALKIIYRKINERRAIDILIFIYCDFKLMILFKFFDISPTTYYS